MTSVIHFILLVGLTSTSVQGLSCRRCINAQTLADCTSMETCGPDEECYMDELITEQLTIVYNAGCRARAVCGVAGKKRVVLYSCSRCCDNSDGCNTHLCGITDPINSNKCYSCDSTHSDQSQTSTSGSCATLTTCQHDEMCFVQGGYSHGGQMESRYGCRSKTICRFLMNQAFLGMQRCETNPDPALCGIGAVGRRAVSTCNACCGDGGCNYGSCNEILQRLYNLHKAHSLDPVTLQVVNSTASTSG